MAQQNVYLQLILVVCRCPELGQAGCIIAMSFINLFWLSNKHPDHGLAERLFATHFGCP